MAASWIGTQKAVPQENTGRELQEPFSDYSLVSNRPCHSENLLLKLESKMTPEYSWPQVPVEANKNSPGGVYCFRSWIISRNTQTKVTHRVNDITKPTRR